MVAAAICAGAVTASVPVIMTGVAFAADQKLELPNVSPFVHIYLFYLVMADEGIDDLFDS